MTTVYRPILKVAWQIIWRAKYLWFFGFFAAFVAASGEFNLMINNFSDLNSESGFANSLKDLYTQGLLGNFGSHFIDLLKSLNPGAWLLVALLFLLLLFFVWLSTVSEAGVIMGAYREYRKQPSDFMLSFKAGRQNFWPVFWLNLLGKVFVYAALFILSAPLLWIYLKTANTTWQLILFLISFVILIPVSAIISFLIKYAVMYAVLRKEKISGAIKNGWQLFLKNWVVSLEMAILMFLVSIMFGLAMIVLAIVLAIPLALILYVIYTLNVAGSALAAVLIALIFLAIIFFVIGAMLSTYQLTAWVLLFDRLNESQVFPKIARLIAGFMERRKNSSVPKI